MKAYKMGTLHPAVPSTERPPEDSWLVMRKVYTFLQWWNVYTFHHMLRVHATCLRITFWIVPFDDRIIFKSSWCCSYNSLVTILFEMDEVSSSFTLLLECCLRVQDCVRKCFDRVIYALHLLILCGDPCGHPPQHIASQRVFRLRTCWALLWNREVQLSSNLVCL